MAIHYKDIRSQINTSAPNLTIARPLGLAVGDFMLMLLNTSGGATSEWGLLAGWSGLVNIPPNAAGHTRRISWKFATAADVAATNFQPSCTGTGGAAGSIVTYTGVHKVNPEGASHGASVTDGTIELNGVTMRAGSTRLIIGFTSANTTGDTAGVLGITNYSGLGLNLRDNANAGAGECGAITFDALGVSGLQPAVVVESVVAGNTSQYGIHLELKAAPLQQGVL